ncbi:hypothetical protein [Halobacterium wangiae]|uniref:hypothetical protein n=1 Tax=Halobacterium wangiae TaxID=2902623 RepID=UPI001E64AC6E|nr:hypothetical protein [Halobacterium wangiae]
MALTEIVVYATHLLFAGLWTGSVLFAAVTLPSVSSDLPSGVRRTVAGRLRNVSRASALFLLLTGGYMLTLAGYTDGGVLTGTGRGHLVLAMVALWFLLAGVVEVAGSRLEDGEDATGLLYVGGVLSVLLLLDAGALAGGI